MIISTNGEVLNKDSDTIEVMSKSGVSHCVQGFFFVLGFESGEKSISEVIRIMEKEKRIPFDQMYGSYVYLIRDTGRTFCFSCNSMLRSVYMCKYGASNSFLELLSYVKERDTLHFNSESVSEYYSLGNIYFNKTFVSEISILDNDKYLLWENNKLTICDKGIGDIEKEGRIKNAKQFYEELAVAIQKYNVALSLTGGYDSRLVLSQLYDKTDMTLFFTANFQTKDGNVADKVADTVGKELIIIKTEKPKITEEYIVDMVEESDGMQPLSLDSDCRLNNARTVLTNMGINFQLTGDGGVLHKDWEWMQDLPFYHKKKTNLKKFYYQRLAFARKAPFCGAFIQDAYEQQENYFIKSMKKYVKRINTQSYDALYHYVSGNRSNLYNHKATKLFTLYAPLTEFDMVRYSYHLPRRERFFYNHMRKMITSANCNIAKLPTNYGTTASAQKIYLLRDIFFQIKEYAVKAIRMLRRKFNIRPRSECVLDWSLDADLRELSVSSRALEWAISKQIVSAEANTNNLPYTHLTRLVHMFVLYNNYDIR